MADKCHMSLLGLIILYSIFTGNSGEDHTHVFYSSGENVRLPCNNALSDCTSTTWTYKRHSGTVELITGGEKKKDIERRERLSLGSDCSLNIKKFTKEDYGSYSCRQYVNGQQQGTDAHVHLHFLHVSSSSSQTEISPGSSVTLFCQLYYDQVSCDILVRTEGVQLIWVNQAGVNLQTDSRYQISFSSGHCISTLTTTLLNEDHNREWRCLVSQRNEVKTSATYTVKYTTPVKTSVKTPAAPTQAVTTVIPVHITNSEDPSTRITPESPKLVSPLVVVMLVIFPALAVLIPAVMLWVIYTKKADTKEIIDSDVLTYVTYSGIAAENLSKRIIYSF